MNTPKIISRFLIAFVLLSVGYVAFRSVRATRDWNVSASLQAATPEPEGPAAPGARSEAGSKIIAYYFHVNVRCTTCRAIETYSSQAIHKRFKDDMAAGRLEWRLVNVQNPENRHFIEDFKLFTKSLVLVRIQDGRQQEYKVLNDTWELVRTPELMGQYVEKETRDFLRKLF
jgi:hypothetical protein